MLYGPPGTGKTLLAGALARSSGMAFVSTSVADWFVAGDGHLGAVTNRANAFFQEVLANAPALGFLDEIDAIPDRAALDPEHREWWQTVVTGVLLMLSRTLATDRPIMLVAATNHLGHLDAALRRPGRFGRHVCVRPAETEAEVAALLDYHLHGELDPDEIAQLAGIAGLPTAADVEGWVKAARAMARTVERPVMFEDVLAQLAPADDRPPGERRRVALHEAGHALAALHFGFEVKHASIVSTGATAGATVWRTRGSHPGLLSIENQAVVALAGRATDIVLGQGPDSGAIADLLAATRLLVSADAALGLRETLVARANDTELLLRTDPALRRRTDAHLRRLMRRALDLVTAQRFEIAAVADALLARRILSGAEIQAVRRRPARKPPARAAGIPRQPRRRPDPTTARAAHRSADHGAVGRASARASDPGAAPPALGGPGSDPQPTDTPAAGDPSAPEDADPSTRDDPNDDPRPTEA